MPVTCCAFKHYVIINVGEDYGYVLLSNCSLAIKVALLIFIGPTLGFCGDPGVPTSGRRNVTGTTQGHTVTYACITGYRVSGSTTRTCQSDGIWSGSLPSCTRECIHNEPFLTISCLIATKQLYSSVHRTWTCVYR